MRRIFLIVSMAAGGLMVSLAVFAAGGGGGGGGGTTCNADSWSCTEWSSCTPNGTQTRTCSMIFDCPTAVTPSPQTTQSCTPPTPQCTTDVWECSDWNACASNGTQTRTCTLTFDCPIATTPRPAESVACTPTPTPAPAPSPTPTVPPPSTKPVTCEADIWKCGAWSACDADGNQKRTCTITVECPSVNTLSPLTQQRCDHLQCGNLPTLTERVMCRVNLTPAGIERELEIQYLPEECRAEISSSARDACIAKYKAIVPCYELPEGEERFACGRQKLGLEANLNTMAAKCSALTPSDREACLTDLRMNVYDMIKFRFYDLEERAEDLFERDASTKDIGEFVAIVESKKIAFNQARTKTERLAIVHDVRVAWKKFVETVKPTLTR